MAQSAAAKASAESREGGLVMHNKMIKYEQVISVSVTFTSNRLPWERLGVYKMP